MRRTRLTKLLALTIVFIMVMSSTVFGAIVPATRISNTLEATFNVAGVSPIANVSDLAGLKAALGDANITTINITNDIVTSEEIVVSRPVTINGGSHSITFTGDTPEWNGDYVLHVYKTTGVIIDNINLTAADGALLVNGSEVELTGSVDVSGNEFGGIEVSQGENVTEIPKLTVTGTLVNSSEEIGLPTAWIDGTVGSIISTPDLTQINIDNQKQFYIDSTKAVPVNLIGLNGTIAAKVNELKKVTITAALNTNVESVQGANLVIDVIKVGGNIASTDLTINGNAGTLNSENNKLTFISDLVIGSNELDILFNMEGNYEFDVYVTQ